MSKPLSSSSSSSATPSWWPWSDVPADVGGTWRFEYKTQTTEEERKALVERAHKRFPGAIPVVVEVDTRSGLPALSQTKFLLRSDMTVGHFMVQVRQRLGESVVAEKAIFLMVRDTLPPVSQTLSTLYQQHKEPCGFMYAVVRGESVFG